MTLEEFIQNNLFDKRGRLCSGKMSEYWFTKHNFQSYYNELQNYIGETLSQKVHSVLNGIKERPTCLFCNSFTAYKGYSKGYEKTCGKDTSCYLKAIGTGTKTHSLEERQRASERMKRNNPMFNKETVKQSTQTKRDNGTCYWSRERKDNKSIQMRKFFTDLNDGHLEGHLYIIKSKEFAKVKIGIASSIPQRFRELKRDFGEFEVLKTISNIEYKELRQLEKMLHEHFNEYCQPELQGGGRTEWFNECIHTDLMNLIRETL